MYNLYELFASLRKLEISLSVQGDNLRCSGDIHLLSDIHKQSIIQHKTEILLLLRQQNDRSKVSSQNKDHEKESRIRLIPSQLFYYRLHTMPDVKSERLCITFSITLSDTVSDAQLMAAIYTLVKRHDALRIKISQDPDGTVYQTVVALEKSKLDIKTVNCSTQSALAAQACITAAQSAPFNLSDAPLLRTTILEVEGAENILIVTVPRIICDGDSTRIVTHDLQNILNGSESIDTIVPSFFEYANRCHSSSNISDKIAQQIRDASESSTNGIDFTSLPFQQHGSGEPYSVSCIGYKFDEQMSTRLSSYSQYLKTTDFCFFLSAFSLNMAKLTNQNSVHIFTSISLRYQELETTQIVGSLSYNCLISAAISDDVSLKELCQSVQSEFISETAISKNIPKLENYAEALYGGFAEKSYPITFLMSDTRNRESAKLPSSEFLKLEPFGTSPMLIHIEKSDDSFLISCNYLDNLYNNEQIESLLDGYVSILEAIVDGISVCSLLHGNN